ncbi:SDR family oxidoreductase [Bacillus suaedae]|uniref:SDR family oxidoreductase n=1 Tax=Halalkalibacter suaedae TaxID=2822140 RepID=A0A941ATV7_9BACI|nr:SDR family oxidoreductase [Bacillus suaedae]
MKKLQGKVVVVTGGSSGIGRASAIQLAEQGAKVALLDVNDERTEQTKHQIEATGVEALSLHCNVANSLEVQRSIASIVEKWGRIDVVCANAGIVGTLSSIETMALEQWHETIDINLKGTFLTVKHTIPFLKKNGGSIIITSSVSGNRVFSQPGFSVYSTSKAGQIAFMKMAALELAQSKIRVNAICPGAIETNIGDSITKTSNADNVTVPLKFPEGDKPLEHRPGTPDQVAKLVLFLATDASSHITGTEIYIDGAESLLRG